MKRLFVPVFLALLFFNSLAAPSLAYTAAEYTNAGLQVYAKKDYALAVRYFTAALALDPADSRALQSRANCYYFLGQNNEALADYEKVLAANPSGPVSQFVQALRAKAGSPAATSGNSVSAPASPNTPTLEEGKAAGPQKPGGLGLRLEPAFVLMNLPDFLEDNKRGKADEAVSQLTDQTYKFNPATVPSGYLNVGVEPVVQIGSNLEVGLPFSIMSVGNVSSSVKGANYSDTVSYSIGAFSVGLNGRLMFGPGPLKIFAGGGALMVPVGLSYTDIVNQPSGTTQNSGNFSSSAFGFQGQLGFDFHVGEPFVLSLFGGYQSVLASAFKGNLSTSGNGSPISVSGQLGIFDDINGKKIIFLKDGDPSPLNFRPLQIDLSGIQAGIHLAIFF